MATLPAPRTGHHTSGERLVREALAHFFEAPETVSVAPTSGGALNVMLYVTPAGGQRYVLRIYNNGNRSENVVWEHEVLRQVNQQQLSFQTPRAVPAKDGRRHVLLSSGAECCVFHAIPGDLAAASALAGACLPTPPTPACQCPPKRGLCCGLPSAPSSWVGPLQSSPPRWGTCNSTRRGPSPPIGMFLRATTTSEAAGSCSTTRSPPTLPSFQGCPEAMAYLVEQVRLMEGRLEQLHALDLPKQVVHGDLHYDNVLVLGDVVSGVLDFEFCAYNWRAMEAAVVLAEYVQEPEPLPLIQGFADGYAQCGHLTLEEVAVIPDLVNLRVLSNVIFFASRAMAKEDGYERRVRWVNENRDAVVDAIKSRMPLA